MKEQIIEKIREFVKNATVTQNMEANSIADFIGWLENNSDDQRDESN